MIKEVLNLLTPRVVMTIIMTAVVTSGIFTSKLLLWVGVEQILIRYPLVIILTYLCFLILVWLWVNLFKQVTIDQPSPPVQAHLDQTVNSKSSSQSDYLGTFNNIQFGDLSFGDIDIGDSDGAAVFFFIFVLIAIIAVSIYAIWQAPILLEEVMLQTVLASGLIRKTTRSDSIGMLKGLVRSTIIPFIVVFSVVMIFTMVAYAHCSTSSTLSEILNPSCQETKARSQLQLPQEYQRHESSYR